MTLVAGVLLYWLQYIPLPGSKEIGWIDHPVAGPIDLMVIPKSYGFIFGWFILVEIAAWAVPRWRGLRQSGADGRSRLNRVTLYLAVCSSALQALFLAVYLRSMGLIGPGTSLLWLISGAAAACVVFVLVGWVERHGIGKGWSILVLVVCVDKIWTEARFLFEENPGSLVFGGSVALILTVATAWSLRVGSGTDFKWLPMPTTGLVPLVGPSVLLTDFVTRAADNLVTPDSHYELPPRDLMIRMVIVLLLGILCHHVYFGDTARKRPPEVGRRSLIASLVFLAVVAAAEHSLGVWGVFVLSTTWVILVAIVHDLLREGRFRREYGELASIGQLNRLAELPQAMAALDGPSIPATALGQGHRSMFHFFAPYVPIDIVVPADCEESARQRLAADP